VRRGHLTFSRTEGWDSEDYEAFFYDYKEQPAFAKCDVKRNRDTEIMISLAGEIAQRLYAPRSCRRWGAQTDYERVYKTVRSYITLSPRAGEAYIAYLKVCAEEALQLNWYLVEALAAELLLSRTLDGGETERFLREHRVQHTVQPNTAVESENWNESSEM
jgi:hypothetical protein